jgi:hypothetical protein
VQRNEALWTVAVRNDLKLGIALEGGKALAHGVGPVREKQADLIGRSLDGARVPKVGHGRTAVVLVRLAAHLAQDDDRQVRVLTNTRLVMQMLSGELVIWFEASRIELKAGVRHLRSVRRVRGVL